MVVAKDSTSLSLYLPSVELPLSDMLALVASVHVAELRRVFTFSSSKNIRWELGTSVVLDRHVPERRHHSVFQVEIVVAMKEMFSWIICVKIEGDCLAVGNPNGIQQWPAA